MREVVGYESCYKVTRCGKVFSIGRNKWMSTHLDRDGYERLTLCKENIKKYKSVHRLVADAFIPNPLNLDTVDHIDGNTLNNSTANLRWMTRENNTQRATSRAFCIRTPAGMGIWAPNKSAFCRQYNLDPSTLSRVIYGKTRQHKGYTRYENTSYIWCIRHQR